MLLSQFQPCLKIDNLVAIFSSGKHVVMLIRILTRIKHFAQGLQYLCTMRSILNYCFLLPSKEQHSLDIHMTDPPPSSFQKSIKTWFFHHAWEAGMVCSVPFSKISCVLFGGCWMDLIPGALCCHLFFYIDIITNCGSAIFLQCTLYVLTQLYSGWDIYHTLSFNWEINKTNKLMK